METDKPVEGEDYYIDDAVNPGEAAMEAAGENEVCTSYDEREALGLDRLNTDPTRATAGATAKAADAEARRKLIQEMQDRARKNVGEHEVHQFPLDKEIGGFYVKSERGKARKDDDKKPGMIHTLEAEDGTNTRFWGFGILDFHLEENKIKAGDYIVVTRREKSEKNMWQCDFGYAKKADVEEIGTAHKKGGD